MTESAFSKASGLSYEWQWKSLRRSIPLASDCENLLIVAIQKFVLDDS